MTRITYTRDNIEDWDFRSYVSPLHGSMEERMRIAPGVELFLSTHFTDVLAVDYLRIVFVKGLVESGIGELSDDKEYVTLYPGGEAIIRHMTSWRDSLSSDGRFRRRIVKSLVREWEKYGRLKFTIMPADMKKQFPGLFEDATAESV